MIAQDVIGVDIAKDWIDVFTLSHARHERIATTKPALRRFAHAAKGALAVLEASGGYERPLTEALTRAGVPNARVNPRQAREFTRTTSRLAKTDRVDAEVLARMCRALELQPTPPQDPDRARLSDLVARREDLTTTTRREKNRAGTTRDAWIAQEIAVLFNVLQDHLAVFEKAIGTLIETRDRLAAEARRLSSIPGLGRALAAVLIARLPKLGSLDHRKVAINRQVIRDDGCRMKLAT
jgi:transposase